MIMSLLRPLPLLLALLLPASIFSQGNGDYVRGNLIQFNSNGAWCWYQDERALVDTLAGKLLVGSVASGSGVGGNSRDARVEAVIFDLTTAALQRHILIENDPRFYTDDHNAPAFLVRRDGQYLALYAAHFGDTTTHYRVYDGNAWGPEQLFDWNAQFPDGANFQTTYSNVYYLADEDRIYNFVRGNNRSPNIMISGDMGDSWSYGGQLTRSGNVGYNNGYYRYWGNGANRIDFVFTEYHPRDYNTSLFHGYIENGQSFASDGTLADPNVLDTLNIPTPADFTEVFAANTVLNGTTLSRCWNIDVQWYSDGSVTTLFKARINDSDPPSNDPQHAFLWAHFDGSSWNSTYLGRAGRKLYSSE